MLFLRQIVNSPFLLAAFLGWFLAQFIKPFIEYIQTREWNWGLWFSSGGMPSSHSSTVTATSITIGLFEGFDTPLFALSFAVAAIVIYDAAGVRRQAGIQAQKINQLIQEFFSGHPISEEQLKELIGHTPRQVFWGVLLGLAISLLIWWLW
ncbi:MAG TPA: divergent PAP2 family protein [Anaerolineaceae bacterium]